MADDIGSIRSIDGTSTALNNQKGDGGQKPSAKGNSNPGDTKPPESPMAPSPIAK